MAGAQGLPSPQAPHPSPTRFFREDETARKHCRFPSGNRPPGTRRKEPLPKPRKKTTAYQTAKARRYGGLFCLYGKRAAEKICLLPIYAEPAETGRQALTPAFPAPCSVASKRTSHKEGTTRLPILRLRVRAKRAAATEKEATTPHESGAAQRLEKGERLPGTCCGHRKTRPLNASHEPFPRAFSV